MYELHFTWSISYVTPKFCRCWTQYYMPHCFALLAILQFCTGHFPLWPISQVFHLSLSHELSTSHYNSMNLGLVTFSLTLLLYDCWFVCNQSLSNWLNNRLTGTMRLPIHNLQLFSGFFKTAWLRDTSTKHWNIGGREQV
jgi:hypothetical protein